MIADSPLHAIRLKCLDCSCGSSYEVEYCPCTDCPLYEYRHGHRVGFYERRDEKKRERKNSSASGEEITDEGNTNSRFRINSRFGRAKLDEGVADDNGS